ncbi:hypothetical protein JCM11641_003895 [Rhodosporidiobolus odoratus]
MAEQPSHTLQQPSPHTPKDSAGVDQYANPLASSIDTTSFRNSTDMQQVPSVVLTPASPMQMTHSSPRPGSPARPAAKKDPNQLARGVGGPQGEGGQAEPAQAAGTKQHAGGTATEPATRIFRTKRPQTAPSLSQSTASSSTSPTSPSAFPSLPGPSPSLSQTSSTTPSRTFFASLAYSIPSIPSLPSFNLTSLLPAKLPGAPTIVMEKVEDGSSDEDEGEGESERKEEERKSMDLRIEEGALSCAYLLSGVLRIGTALCTMTLYGQDAGRGGRE